MDEAKPCSKCGEEKPLDEYTRRPEGRGTVSRCKACKAEDQRERRLRNPERARDIQRRAWKNGGAERDRERKQRRKTEDFFGYHLQFARRFNKSITREDLVLLWQRQDGCCGLTGRPMTPEAGRVSLDHIQPQAKGGGHDLRNLRWVCTEANLLKRDLTDQELLEICSDVAEWIGQRILDQNRKGDQTK